MNDPISLAARLVRAAMWDQSGEMPTRDEFHGLCQLMRDAGVFIRDQYDRQKENDKADAGEDETALHVPDVGGEG